MEESGIVYLALNGLAYMQMAMVSMTSVRRSGYRGPIVVVTDLPTDLWHGTDALGFRLINLDDLRDLPAGQPEVTTLKAWKTRLDVVPPSAARCISTATRSPSAASTTCGT